nr:hypothetical protein BaRGS_026673 [Batillaria attramentaria]
MKDAVYLPGSYLSNGTFSQSVIFDPSASQDGDIIKCLTTPPLSIEGGEPPEFSQSRAAACSRRRNRTRIALHWSCCLPLSGAGDVTEPARLAMAVLPPTTADCPGRFNCAKTSLSFVV